MPSAESGTHGCSVRSFPKRLLEMAVSVRNPCRFPVWRSSLALSSCPDPHKHAKQQEGAYRSGCGRRPLPHPHQTHPLSWEEAWLNYPRSRNNFEDYGAMSPVVKSFDRR